VEVWCFVVDSRRGDCGGLRGWLRCERGGGCAVVVKGGKREPGHVSQNVGNVNTTVMPRKFRAPMFWF
jgi:hypothetical protein